MLTALNVWRILVASFLQKTSPPKRSKPSKGSDAGQPKKGNDAVIEILVALRKEPPTYVDVKMKQMSAIEM